MPYFLKTPSTELLDYVLNLVYAMIRLLGGFMVGLKPAIICGAAGFVLSFLVGLLSGVSFFVILGRALIVGAVLGGLSYAAMHIFKKYLPELFSDAESETASPQDDERGKNLNIVIDDENEAQVKDAAEAPVDPGQIDSLGNIGTTVNTEQFTASKSSSDDISGQQTTQSADQKTAPLEELPNLEAFENPADSTIAETTADLIDAGTESLRRTNETNIDASNVPNMAKAIHTILKKENT